MIADIVKMIQSNNWYGYSENIEIAKGKYALIKNRKQAKEQIKRAWRSLKK